MRHPWLTRATLTFAGVVIALAVSAQRSNSSVPVIPCYDHLLDKRIAVIYLDRYRAALPGPDSACFYSVYRQTKDSAAWLRVRTYTVFSHRLVEEQVFLGKPGTLAGTFQSWGAKGQLDADATFLQRGLGNMHIRYTGPVKTWHANGQLARDAVYTARGKSVRQNCYDSAGNPISCPSEPWTLPVAPEGKDYAKFLYKESVKFRSLIPDLPKYQSDGLIEVSFVIDSLGYVRNPRFLAPSDAPEAWRQAALQFVRKLPRFEPARYEGTPHHEPIAFHLPTR